MRIRSSVLPLLLIGLAACPKDKKKGAADSVAVAPPIVADTTPTDLSSVQTSLPPAAPDTFKRLPPPKPPRTEQAAAPSYPQAPSALMDAVQRSQTVSKFCYQEFGQKVDPTLRGGVAVDTTGVDWTVGAKENTGDGIRAGLGEGAATDFLDDSWWGPAIPLPEEPYFCLAERSTGFRGKQLSALGLLRPVPLQVRPPSLFVRRHCGQLFKIFTHNGKD